MEEELLKIQDISKKYDTKHALQNVTLIFPQRAIYGILGPNGAGKTTLLRIITGILAPDSGHTFFNANLAEEFKEVRISYLPEERGLYKKMSVRDCLLFFSRLQNMRKKEALKKISFWLNKFSLREKEKSKVEELSKGLQQKLQLIIALISEPQLIILDEPFSGLDPLSEAVARDVILEMNKKGHTFILSTHRMENVESLCTHVVFLNKGKVLLDGKVEEIKEKFSENLYEVTGEGTLSNDVNTYSLLSRKQEKNVIVAQLKAKNNTDSNEIIRELLPDFKIQSFKRQTPDIESIFFRLIKDDEK